MYTWHVGKCDVKALVEEASEWNEMIAAHFVALKTQEITGEAPLGCA